MTDEGWRILHLELIDVQVNDETNRLFPNASLLDFYKHYTP
jgi:hypothetical protein